MNALPVLLFAALTSGLPPLRLHQPEPDVQEPDDWAEQHFGTAELGDRRRTRRLVTVAAQAAQHPSGSIPQQSVSWADTKAAYRLWDAEGVTFANVCDVHWQKTRACAPGSYLLLGDTTEIDFGGQRELGGASPLGNGSGQGFLLHSSLCVSADSDAVYGLAGQTIHYRQPAPKKESAHQRVKRADRETHVWTTVIDQVGTPPAQVQWIHVFDRGADNFEVFCHVRTQGTEAIVRACNLHRKIWTPQQEEKPLRDYLRDLPVAGRYTLPLRARGAQAARRATLTVRWGALTMARPRVASPYAKEQPPVALHVVWVSEEQPPPGVAKIAWVLYTTLPVADFAAAQRIIAAYEKRWLIEEWHKALKTGGRVEQRQLQTTARLEPLVGLLGIVAVRLLQLRGLARSQPERLAMEVVPALYVRVLQGLRKAPRDAVWTVRQFFRALAQLGGFLGRKGDGEPGWQTIWRGWDQLQWAVRGARVIHDLND